LIDDVFIMHRSRLGEDRGWSLAAPVNTPDYRESYPSVVADGSLYFSSDRPGGIGGGDIYVSFEEMRS
jgi:hypothetical protein